MSTLNADFDSAFVAEIPVIVKGREDRGKRLLEVESSVEKIDGEGDVILQSALLDGADEFVRTGHVDVDHISEIGTRLGIPNPESFIIGRPTAVTDIGDKRTSVTAEIFTSPDGKHNPQKNRYDAIWDAIRAGVLFRASVYGFPKNRMTVDCRTDACSTGAKRYQINGMDWRSLALTRNPVNDHLKGYARIVSAKAYLAVLAKSYSPVYPAPMVTSGDGQGMPPMAVNESASPPGTQAAPFPPPGPGFPAPRSMAEAVGQHRLHMRKDCPYTGGMNSTMGFRNHFKSCCGMPEDMADVWAHALMHSVLLDKRRV